MYDLNKFYGINLGRGKVIDTQVYVSKTGHLQLDVLTEEGGCPCITFKNYSEVILVEEVEGVDFNIINPLTKHTNAGRFLTRPVKVWVKQELDFLKEVEVGVEMSVESQSSLTKARALTNLLNDYRVLGRWVTGSMGDYSTANFTLLHLGEITGEWDGVVIDSSPYGAIIKIDSGSNKGLLCLTT